MRFNSLCIVLAAACAHFGMALLYPGAQQAAAQHLAQASGPPSAVSSPPQAVREFSDCAECPRMVEIPAGRFSMGSPDNEPGRTENEGPVHEVTIGAPFALGRYPVTIREFQTFVAETGYTLDGPCYAQNGGDWTTTEGQNWQRPGYPQDVTHPVVCVNWHDAKAYAQWIAKKTGKPYRLPTEAEWEYAARAQRQPGNYPRYFFGDDIGYICAYANGADLSAKRDIPGAATWSVATCDDGYAYTSPVGSYLPNRFGLYDMHGNVWQWVEDCFHDTYSSAPSDGSAWVAQDCSRRVMRGGSWYNYPRYLRAAYRTWCADVDRQTRTGFRLALSLQ